MIIKSTQQPSEAGEPGGRRPAPPPLSPFESRRNLHPLTAGPARDYLGFLPKLFEPVQMPEPPSRGSAQAILDGDLSRVTRAAPMASIHWQAAQAPGRLRLRARPQGPPPAFATAALERPGFPIALGRFCAWLSDRSYDRWLSVAHPLVSRQRSFDRDHAQALGLVFEEHAFLAFRGSESRVDWFRNLLVRREHEEGDPAARVHRGFRHNLDLLWPEVTDWLAELPETRRVILTGHSLGGAMAVLAARRLAVAGRRVAAVITFGSPRIGDAGFEAAYERLGLGERTWRVIWGGDLVTKMPPLPGYRHVGSVEAIGSPRELETNPFMQPLAGASNDLWRVAAMVLSARNPWVYGALLTLPSFLGLAHAGREHRLSLGYSSVHDRILEEQLEAALRAFEPELDASGRATLTSMHRAYFTGEGIAPPAPTS